MQRRLTERKINIDKELVILLLLVAMAGFIYFFIVNQRAFLNVFYLPVLLGAYYFGKRYAIISSTLSVAIILIVAWAFPQSFALQATANAHFYKWLDLATWGLFLVFTGYCMGILYDKKEEARKELQRTYSGIIEMLSMVIESADNYTQSHSHRVSIIAEMIARQMRLNPFEIENIRVAALLHDLGKIGVSEAVLQKVTDLTVQEKVKMRQHAWLAVNMLEPLGETVGDILPIILHHHEKYDGSGYYKAAQGDIPLGARIIAVADVYDALTTDRPYRKAFSSLQAKQEILSNAGTHFDPDVVKAFNAIFPYLETENYLFPARAKEVS
ncbi:MAG: HD domain-containing protein [Smithellaceae bacterium]